MTKTLSDIENDLIKLGGMIGALDLVQEKALGMYDPDSVYPDEVMARNAVPALVSAISAQVAAVLHDVEQLEKEAMRAKAVAPK